MANKKTKDSDKAVSSKKSEKPIEDTAKVEVKENSSKRRKMKPAESFRDKADKAYKVQLKQGRFKRVSLLILKHVVIPFKYLAKAFDHKPLKWLRKPLKILSYILVPVYFRRSAHELKQVSWPSFRESIKLTYAVIVFAVVFGAGLAVLDAVLGRIFKHILLK